MKNHEKFTKKEKSFFIFPFGQSSYSHVVYIYIQHDKDIHAP